VGSRVRRDNALLGKGKGKKKEKRREYNQRGKGRDGMPCPGMAGVSLPPGLRPVVQRKKGEEKERREKKKGEGGLIQRHPSALHK